MKLVMIALALLLPAMPTIANGGVVTGPVPSTGETTEVLQQEPDAHMQWCQAVLDLFPRNAPADEDSAVFLQAMLLVVAECLPENRITLSMCRLRLELPVCQTFVEWTPLFLGAGETIDRAQVASSAVATASIPIMEPLINRLGWLIEEEQ